MKSSRFLLPFALMSLSTVGFAQSDTSHPGTHSEAHGSSMAAVSSETQQSFDQLKSLAGEWTGPVTVAEMPELHTTMALSMRVTSRGHVVVHEFQEAGTPLDPTKYDHPVTMFYVDGDQLTLVHYCDAGNRPRMIGTRSPDTRTVDFELKDISGSTEYHMHHAVLTVIDENHHTEDWTFMMKDKPIHAHFDLRRKH